MKVVGYVRVSTEGQLDAYGMDAQTEALRSWCRINGHRLVQVFSDEGVSGTLDFSERPGLSAALDALRPPPQATGLLVPRLDRLARALHVQEAALQVAWKNGGTVFTVDGGECLRDDPEDPMRTFVRQVIGCVSQLERGMIAKRMRDGRRAKANAGKKATGSYAYGWQGQGQGRERDAVPRSDEQRAVARIVELRQSGLSYRAIAERLDSEGLRPRRALHWSPMSVRNVAQRAGLA